jgi:hypothetical protein
LRAFLNARGNHHQNPHTGNDLSDMIQEKIKLQEPQPRDEQQVVVYPRGDKYHDPSCSCTPRKINAVDLSIGLAIRLGYDYCRCPSCAATWVALPENWHRREIQRINIERPVQRQIDS